MVEVTLPDPSDRIVDAEALRRRMTNHAFYDLWSLWRKVQGVDITRIEADLPFADWFASAAAVIRRAVLTMNLWLLALGPVDDSPLSTSFAARMVSFDRWLDDAGTANDVAVAREVWAIVKMHVTNMADPEDAALFRVVHVPTPQAPSPSVDVFVSYKHARYGDVARMLHDALEQRGLRVWLDQLDLALSTWVEATQLRRWLRDAVQAATLTVFFETYDQAVADARGGVKRAFNWQAYERKHANAVVDIRPDRQLIASSDGVRTYDDDEELVGLLADLVPLAARDTDARHRSAREVDAAHAADDVSEYLTECFGTALTLPTRTLLSLLPPAEHNMPLLIDDYFAHLLRLDPASALAARRAGLDVGRFLAIAASPADEVIREPSSYLCSDLFGDRSLVEAVPAVRAAADAGLFGVRDLATALAHGYLLAYSPNRPLVHALAPDADDTGARAALESFVACFERECQEHDTADDQRWLLVAGDEPRCVWPVVAVDSAVLLDEHDDEVTVAVYRRQFDPPFSALGDVVVPLTRRDVVEGQPGPLAEFLLRDTHKATVVAVSFVTTEDPRRPLLLLHTFAAPVQVDGSPAQRLAQAAQILDTAPPTAGATLPWPIGPMPARAAVILSAVDPRPPRATSAQTMATLSVSLLAPLWADQMSHDADETDR